MRWPSASIVQTDTSPKPISFFLDIAVPRMNVREPLVSKPNMDTQKGHLT
jgi:hypothetical protein